MTTRRFTMPLCALSLLLALALPCSSSANDSVLDAFDGTWTRVAIAEDDSARDSAITRAISGLSWMMRTMAGPILRNSVAPPGRLAFEIDGDAIEFSEQGRGSRPLPLDGSEIVTKGEDGGTYRLRSVLEEAGILTSWVGNQAKGSNLYRVSDDGSQLVIEHKIVVTQISGVELIAFESRFARTPEVAARASE